MGMFSVPHGVSVESEWHSVNNIRFLHDLTYMRNDGEWVQEQEIFDEVIDVINQAEQFVVLDMFLINDEYDRTKEFPALSERLVNALIEKKKKSGIPIFVTSDELNTCYGVYRAEQLEKLKNNGIQVTMTDMSKMPDSNLFYSLFWRILFRWFGTSGKGWLPNPISPDSPKLTLRAYLKLINFKANHRKVVINEKFGVVSSANPHDESFYNSNIAFRIEGDILKDIYKTEKSIVEFSGSKIDFIPEFIKAESGDIKIKLITEGKTRNNLLYEIVSSNLGDEIKIGCFYLGHRKIIKELIEASKRGVKIKIIADQCKDSFGRPRSGIPNVPAAYELLEKSNNKIKLKWFNTQIEQFHSKILIKNTHLNTIIIGGSANLTRRNLDDLNLEENVKIMINKEHELSLEINEYYEKMWENKDGIYTIEVDRNRKIKFSMKMMYLFQEYSGMSTF